MKKALVMGRQSPSTFMLIKTLENSNYDVKWIEERRDDKKSLLLKRIKKQGAFKVFGQLLFMVLQRALKRASQQRQNELLEVFGNLPNYTPELVTTNVNSDECINKARSLSADVVVLSGTRILSKHFLGSLDLPILNIHAGITPKYRGVHGGYWSLVNQDETHCGSTIHRVDEGVDTGSVLAYATIQITQDDNFVTYPILQQMEALKLLPQVLNGLDLRKEPSLTVTQSSIWSHPTIFQYIYYRLKFGVK